jgi:hypothetical protein
MPNWKKVIVSGSDAALNSLNVRTSFTASSLIYPTIDGISNQAIITDGAGNLTFGSPSSTNTVISIKNVSGATIQKGTPCYITGSGTSGNVAGVWPADASNPLRMPAGVIAGETLIAGAEGTGFINGFINGVDTSAFNAGDSVYVKVGGGYTNIRPTGSTIYVQKLGNVEKSAVNGSGVINGPNYYNDLPNIQQGFTWIGNSNGVATAVATSSIQNVVSSSFASTASFVNPLNQNVIITGSVNISQNITASRAYFSASNGTANGPTLTVYGSGSAQPVLTVQGSQGELFSITDSLSGSLFSVNDISGLPILEVFSDNTILMGNYQDPMLITTTKLVTTASGGFVLYSLPTSSYDTAFFEYSIKSGSNARAGTIMAIQSGTSVNFTETTTTDFGSTSGFNLAVQVSSGNMILTGSATTSGWTIKTIVRSI